MIVREWPIGTPLQDLFAVLNAMPGTPIPDPHRIGIQAAYLRVKRPVGFRSQKQIVRSVAVPEATQALAPVVAEVRSARPPARVVYRAPTEFRKTGAPLPPIKTSAQIQRDKDAAEVSTFLALKGATRCPIAAANATTATMPTGDRAALRAHTEALEAVKMADHQRRMDGKKLARAARAGA